MKAVERGNGRNARVCGRAGGKKSAERVSKKGKNSKLVRSRQKGQTEKSTSLPVQLRTRTTVLPAVCEQSEIPEQSRRNQTITQAATQTT